MAVDPRIKALLDKANSTSFPEEAKSLRAKARQLAEREMTLRDIINIIPKNSSSPYSFIIKKEYNDLN